MKVAVKTDSGKVRLHNEDSCGAKDNIYIVADGMGGHQAGEIASAVAVDRILSQYNPEMSVKEVEDIILQTNEEIFNMSETDPQYTGMGTTLSLIIFQEDQYHLLHVGDSRIYLFKQQKLQQLTADHSIVGELVRSGGITAEEAINHPQRNVLTRALGTALELEVELVEGKVEKGTVFLLCTDGLYGVVSQWEMENILNLDLPLQEIAEMLVKAANEKGGPDNISVILVQV